MLNSSLIEVAIGLVLVYSLLAILVTQVNNLVTTALNLRAKELKRGIQELITDQQVQAKMLAHPIVSMVKARVPVEVELNRAKAQSIINLAVTNVNYIPPSTFTEALLSILISESDRSLFSPFNDAVDKLPNSIEKSQLRELLRRLRTNYNEATVRETYDLIKRISDESYRQGLINGLQKVEDMLQPLRFKNPELIPILDGISKIQDRRFRSALHSILVSAKTLDEARGKIQDWFNDSMNRVTDSFVRFIGRLSLASALFLVLVLNVDTIALVTALLDDSELRQSVAETARDFEQTQMDALAERFSQARQSSGATETPPLVPGLGESQTAPEGEEGATLEELQERAQEVQDTVQSLFQLNLPIGWEYIPVTQQMIANSTQLGFADPRTNSSNVWNFLPWNNPSWLRLWLQKIVGLAATTIAAAQGAPFWFDLLRKIAQRR